MVFALSVRRAAATVVAMVGLRPTAMFVVLFPMLGLAVAGTPAKPARARPITVAVIGDSLASDLGRGMERLYRGTRNIRVAKQTRYATGLIRRHRFNWEPRLRSFARKTRADIIAVLIGGNDSQSIRVRGRSLPRFSRSWIAEYRRRVARFMAILRRTRAKIHWVGLPPVRSADMSRRYRAINRIFRSEAQRQGIGYVSLWKTFTDGSGTYTSFGWSLRGVPRQLRQNDGMHFTEAGKLSLAAHVSRAIGLL